MTPADMNKRHLSELPASQQAGILCNTPRFAEFCARRGDTIASPAGYVRWTCRVTSRRDLDTNPEARARWDALVTEYDAWRGRIPPQT